MKCFFLTGIPTGRLEEVVSDEGVAMIARDHLTDWESLRPFLGLSRQQEVEICNTHGNYQKQKRECLEIWKQAKGNEATYSTFITTAEKAKNQQLADGVRAMLGISVSHQPPHQHVRHSIAVYVYDNLLYSPSCVLWTICLCVLMLSFFISMYYY